jgi:hypothetical protein
VVDTETLVAIESLALKVECEFKHAKAQHAGLERAVASGTYFLNWRICVEQCCSYQKMRCVSWVSFSASLQLSW